jgi:hypothetical protein
MLAARLVGEREEKLGEARMQRRVCRRHIMNQNT